MSNIYKLNNAPGDTQRDRDETINTRQPKQTNWPLNKIGKTHNVCQSAKNDYSMKSSNNIKKKYSNQLASHLHHD